MEKRKFTYAHPNIIEEKRIKEVRALSYLERLERLFVLIEISQTMSKASKSNLTQDARTNS
ncbi:hypothetical protein SAMN00777080_2754 [Aquiflexum balticum DSM 16537]|uniref:Uncharacterized protein n=1 Tax=Aquiflexum balticum DSM 16537 TaxID=758820 RepID=A0A1W2H5I9_9BACT|nr:hypothetical protein [Aquiflexum balticum]SMD44139.1 hypothetical protein SAMN00777080_2754 [Aquiflexum balticum DSM 16537]